MARPRRLPKVLTPDEQRGLHAPEVGTIATAVRSASKAVACIWTIGKGF